MATVFGQLFRHKDKLTCMLIGAICYQFAAVIYMRNGKIGASLAYRNTLSQSAHDGEIGSVVRLNSSRDHAVVESHPPPVTTKSPTTAMPIETQRLKTILFWNSFFSQDNYGMGSFGQGPFLRGKCRINSCQTTNEHSKLAEADAVIIHGAYGLPPNTLFPKRAFPEQVFIFFEFEPPALLRFSLKNMNDKINLTFTYLHHTDTDIYSPYGIVRPRRNIPMERYIPMKPAQILSKRKKAVWIVSDCHPASKRMEYAKELAKHIDLDIFGKCGRDECPVGKECSDKIEREYKFYLAFENSVCEDYITEKTFKMLLEHHLIPVVLGGANYKRYVPRMSVIDVRDYQSPEHLAKYLHQIDQNDTLFMEYFEWKKQYYIETAPRIDGFCRLCEILHTPGYPFKSSFNMEHYWSPDAANCVRGVDEEKIIHLSN